MGRHLPPVSVQAVESLDASLRGSSSSAASSAGSSAVHSGERKGRYEGPYFLACAFCILFLCCAVAVVHIADFDQENVAWDAQPWVRTSCLIQSVGIAYVGDCPNKTHSVNVALEMRPDYEYTLCHSLLPAVQKSCHKVLQQSYNHPERGDRAVDRRLQQRERRRLHMIHHTHGGADGISACYDHFSPWALLHIPLSLTAEPNGDRAGEACGYRYGLPADSQYGELEDAIAAVERLNRSVGQELPCWHITVMGHLKNKLETEFEYLTEFKHLKCDSIALEDPATWDSVFNFWHELEYHGRPLVYALLFSGFVVGVLYCYGRSHRYELRHLVDCLREPLGHRPGHDAIKAQAAWYQPVETEEDADGEGY